MSKFKVGDKVRILDGSKIKNYTGSWATISKYSPGMDKHVGEVHTIKNIDEDWSNGRVSYELNGVSYDWDERGLELVEQKQPKIVITTDGKTTTAVMYEGNQRIKSATAKCAPGDEFDFGYGARLALDRLTNSAKKKSQMDRFIAGEIALMIPVDSIDKFLEECEKRGLEWYGEPKRPTVFNPVEECTKRFLDGVVYMYHDEGSLEFCETRYGDYTFEPWEETDEEVPETIKLLAAIAAFIKFIKDEIDD